MSSVEIQGKTIVIVGFGAAGQRFTRLIRENFGDSIKIVVVRRVKNQILISSDLKKSSNQNPIVVYKCIEIEEISESLKFNPEFAYIASPNSLHFSDASNFIKAKIPVILEKPAGITHTEVIELANLAKDKNIKIIVPFTSRLHPLFQKLIDLLSEKKIYKAESWFRESPTIMHPYELASTSYITKREYGGGALLALCHEFDFWYALLGPLENIESQLEYGKNSSPETAEIFAEVKLKSKILPSLEINVGLDLTSQTKCRGGQVTTDTQIISWDWTSAELVIQENSREISREIYSMTGDELWSLFIKDSVESIQKSSGWDEMTFNSSLEIARIIDDARRGE
jgi:predicted dehydrogenase